jgi:hypothetical protein
LNPILVSFHVTFLLRRAWHTDIKCCNAFLDWEHVNDVAVVWMIVAYEGRGSKMSVYGPRQSC